MLNNCMHKYSLNIFTGWCMVHTSIYQYACNSARDNVVEHAQRQKPFPSLPKKQKLNHMNDTRFVRAAQAATHFV